MKYKFVLSLVNISSPTNPFMSRYIYLEYETRHL